MTKKKKMMIMGSLEPRQKQEWKSAIDDHWVRTGCEDLWDAVFIAFRDYRDATPTAQKKMIEERTGMGRRPTEEWVGMLQKRFEERHKERADGDETENFFFKLLPLKTFTAEMVPYMLRYIREDPDVAMEQAAEELIDKCAMLAEYRQKKKNFVGVPPDGLKKMVDDYMRGTILKGLEQVSYDKVQEAMANIEHQLIIISPEENVLFDSKTWGDGSEDGEYQDVIVVLAHPDHTYDSIGRISYTKDNHQKISRLFHYDDDIIEALRK